MKDEKIVVIDINLNRGLVTLLALALLVAALLGYLAWGQDEVAASGPQAPLDHAQAKPLAQSSGMRRYYLTQSEDYNGAEADGTDGNGAGVCAEGYHFASLWEILDPSNLEYDTTLGYTLADSGQGPPAGFGGWVRTGYVSGSDLDDAGRVNCDVWTSSDIGDWGTWADLPSNWTAGEEDIHVWQVLPIPCFEVTKVWCVED